MAAADLVLYVGLDRSDATRRRFCPGSRRAMQLADEVGEVVVQSVDALREAGTTTLPEWLQGTPTLVCKSKRVALRGKRAIEHLQQRLAEQRGGGGGEEDTKTGEPTGLIAPHEAMFLGGGGNFERGADDAEEDASKYSDTHKITDADVQRLLDRRNTAAANVPA